MPTLKPATPLPFKDGPLFNQDSRALFWSDTSKPGKHQRRVDTDRNGAFGAMDATYIAHACNAYPRLVAALQALAGHEDDFYQTDATIAARALLRELGEE